MRHSICCYITVYIQWDAITAANIHINPAKLLVLRQQKDECEHLLHGTVYCYLKGVEHGYLPSASCNKTPNTTPPRFSV